MTKRKFKDPEDQQIHDALVLAYEALQEKKYNPIAQLTGFIFSSDPTYLTSYNNTRVVMTKLDTEDILKHILRTYFEV